MERCCEGKHQGRKVKSNDNSVVEHQFRQDQKHRNKQDTHAPACPLCGLTLVRRLKERGVGRPEIESSVLKAGGENLTPSPAPEGDVLEADVNEAAREALQRQRPNLNLM